MINGNRYRRVLSGLLACLFAAVFVMQPVSVSVWAADNAAEPGEYRLPVFETSDIHGSLVDTSGDEVEYRLAYIADKVNDARHGDKDRTILIDGGDIFQGQMISKFYQGQSLSAAFDKMAYDAVTIGNHEFDWKLETLFDKDGTMRDYEMDGVDHVNSIPVVCGNIYRNGKYISEYARPYIILEKKAYSESGRSMDVRVAVIGVADDFADSVASEFYEDMGYYIPGMGRSLEEANELAAKLESAGECDATIVLSHGDASIVSTGLGKESPVDLVCGGHLHQNKKGYGEAGPPFIAPADAASAYVYAELTFDKKDAPADGGAGVSFVKVARLWYERTIEHRDDMIKKADGSYDSTMLDPDVMSVSDYFLAAVQEYLNAKLGYIDVPVKRFEYLPDSGTLSSTSGNWICSMMQREAGADVAFFNAGGMRVDFDLDEDGRRSISIADVYTMYPFGNTIYTYEVTYGELMKIFEYVMVSFRDQGSRLFLYGAMTGIDCWFKDEKVNALVLEDGTPIYYGGTWAGGWKDKKLRVSINSFTAKESREIDGIDNPALSWNPTSRLKSTDIDQFDASVELLREEGKANDGHLAISEHPYYVNKVYSYSKPVAGESFDVSCGTVRIVSAKKKTVKLVKANKSTKTVTLPESVTICGSRYKVTGIAANAFKGSKAKTLVVKTRKLTKRSVRSALKGSKLTKVSVKVSGSKKVKARYLRLYRKIFTKKNAGRTVSVRSA